MGSPVRRGRCARKTLRDSKRSRYLEECVATSIFDLAADELESRSDFEKLEARGTVRLALKAAGLDPRGVTASQMAVVFTRVMPRELVARGVQSPDSICEAIVAVLKSAHVESDETNASSPEEVFRRLASR
jgi:hypothetical protein